MTTFTVQETGIVHRCASCTKKMLAIEHNGALMVKAGRKNVMSNSLSIQCECGHWNHVTIKKKEEVVD